VPAASRRFTAVNGRSSRLNVTRSRADAVRRRLDVPIRHLLERPGDGRQDAIELDAHLERERPAGVVARVGGAPDTAITFG
jgi:hypothetical protein